MGPNRSAKEREEKGAHETDSEEEEEIEDGR